MKKILLIMTFLAIVGNALAAKNRNINNPIIGTWKYTNQSAKNDFQQVLNSTKRNYTKEYFVFESNNKFSHQFVDENGMVIKSLKGTWKSVNDKINIQYSDIEYSVTVDYFFLDKDLVLGQNFNHVIFTKDIADTGNIALK